MKTKRKFTPGRAGCESTLFLVRGYHRTTEITDKDGKPTPQDVLRICANDIEEVLEHIRKWERGFAIRSIRLIGLVVLVSATPYNE
jgi:hypothetical protein